MIYIIRHQQGDNDKNCLNKLGTLRSLEIAKLFKNRCENIEVYTCYPDQCLNRHFRPIQTATIMCTELNQSLRIIKGWWYDVPSKFKFASNVIVWHHAHIKKLLELYYPKSNFEWPSDNYDGCLIIDHNTWRFDEEYLSKPRWCY